MLVILASIFIILLVLGMPIAFTMGIACLGTVVYSQMPLNMLITRMFSATDSFSLMAVPFFILAGELMNEADLTDRILNLARALVGFLRGGLAIVNILASVFRFSHGRYSCPGFSGDSDDGQGWLFKGIQRGGNSGILYYWPHYTTQCHACDVCGDCQRKYY